MAELSNKVPDHDDVDWGEVVVEGLKAVYTDHQEYYRFLMAVAGMAPGLYDKLRKNIIDRAKWELKQDRNAMLDLQVCPDCGGDLNPKHADERVPIPFGNGDATDSRVEYVCDECGTRF